MKQLLTLVFGFLFCYSLIGQTFLTGQVLAPDLDEGLIAANISFYKNDVLLAGTVSDLDGNYRIGLDPGAYDIVFTYIGYKPKKEEGIIIRVGKTNVLNIQMEVGLNLEEVVVIGYKNPQIDQHIIACGQIISRSIKPDQIIEEAPTPLLKIKTYPNPTSNLLNIQLDQPVDYLTLRSIDGKEIISHNNVNTKLIQMDVSSLAAGTYVVQAAKEEVKYTGKVIIIRP